MVAKENEIRSFETVRECKGMRGFGYATAEPSKRSKSQIRSLVDASDTE